MSRNLRISRTNKVVKFRIKLGLPAMIPDLVYKIQIICSHHGISVTYKNYYLALSNSYSLSYCTFVFLTKNVLSTLLHTVLLHIVLPGYQSWYMSSQYWFDHMPTHKHCTLQRLPVVSLYQGPGTPVKKMKCLITIIYIIWL